MHGKNKFHAHAKLHNETCQLLFKNSSGFILICIPARMNRTGGNDEKVSDKKPDATRKTLYGTKRSYTQYPHTKKKTIYTKKGKVVREFDFVRAS